MPLTRRDLLKLGAAGAVATAGTPALIQALTPSKASPKTLEAPAHSTISGPHGLTPPQYTTSSPTGTDPMAFLTAFDYGQASKLANNQILREYNMVSLDATIEVAPGVFYPAWTYNGQVPGPTLRCTEGDHLRIHFTNHQTHPHTIHFHGFHPANMDGAFEIIQAGDSFTYEFTAEPFGLHLYHCHIMPLKKHIAKGLYGAFIVDPPTPRTPAHELVMVMNGYDVNFDDENEFYTVNGAANFYLAHPIQLRVGELVRIYLVNMTEFDSVNSLHTHATFFKLYRTGTRLDQYEYTDTVTLGQGERAIVEFTYDKPGRYMFHAHQSEFAELGWTGIFEVA